jgi:hypothetical protein
MVSRLEAVIRAKRNLRNCNTTFAKVGAGDGISPSIFHLEKAAQLR